MGLSSPKCVEDCVFIPTLIKKKNHLTFEISCPLFLIRKTEYKLKEVKLGIKCASFLYSETKTEYKSFK